MEGEHQSSSKPRELTLSKAVEHARGWVAQKMGLVFDVVTTMMAVGGMEPGGSKREDEEVDGVMGDVDERMVLAVELWVDDRMGGRACAMSKLWIPMAKS